MQFMRCPGHIVQQLRRPVYPHHAKAPLRNRPHDPTLTNYFTLLERSWPLHLYPPLHHHLPRSESARQVRRLQLTRGARPLALPHILVTPANLYAKDGAVLGVSTTPTLKRARLGHRYRRNARVAGRVYILSLPLLDPVHPHLRHSSPPQYPHHQLWISPALIYRYRLIRARQRAAQSTTSRAKTMGGLGRRLLQTASFVGASYPHPSCAVHALSGLKDGPRHNGKRKPVPVPPRLQRRRAYQRRLSANVITDMTPWRRIGWKQVPSARVFSAAVHQRSISRLIRCLLHARNGHRPNLHRPRRITCARLARCRVGAQTQGLLALQPRQHTYRPCRSRDCWRKARTLVTRAMVSDRMTALYL